MSLWYIYATTRTIGPIVNTVQFDDLLILARHFDQWPPGSRKKCVSFCGTPCLERLENFYESPLQQKRNSSNETHPSPFRSIFYTRKNIKSKILKLKYWRSRSRDPTYERDYSTKSKQKQLFGKRDKYRVV